MFWFFLNIRAKHENVFMGKIPVAVFRKNHSKNSGDDCSTVNVRGLEYHHQNAAVVLRVLKCFDAPGQHIFFFLFTGRVTHFYKKKLSS